MPAATPPFRRPSPPARLLARLPAILVLVLGCALALPAWGKPAVRPPESRGRPGSPVGIVDGDGRALDAWHSALRRARKRKGQARMAVFGASHTAADLWTGELRRMLQDRFGDAGHGFVFPAKWNLGYRHQDIVVQASKGWTVLRHKQDNPVQLDDYGLAGLVMTSADPADWALVRSTRDNKHGRKFNRVEVWYRTGPEGGDLLVDIDGRTRLVKTRAAAVEVRLAEYRIADRGHTVRVAPAGNGPVTLYGLVAERSGHGVIVDQLGIPGMRAEVMLHWQEDTWRRLLQRRKPDLVVLAYGTNSVGDVHEPIEVYAETWRKVLRRLRAAAPGAACVVVGPTDRLALEADGQKRTMPRTQAVVETGQRVAAELGCGHWDAVAAMGGPGAMLAWQSAGLASKDDVHLNRQGYPWLAELFHYALLREWQPSQRTASGSGRPADDRLPKAPLQ